MGIGGLLVNDFWPKGWKRALPNFLGEDFFSSFEQFENLDPENQNNQQTFPNKKNLSGIHVNIYESGHELLCIFKLPGLKLKEVDIDIYEETIKVTGSVFVDDHGFRPIQQEIFEGEVERKMKLPYPVRHDKIDASYHHGYLIVLLHRHIRPNESKAKVIINDLEEN